VALPVQPRRRSERQGRGTRHFGPKTFRHWIGGSKLSRHFDTSAEVSVRQFGPNPELSCPVVRSVTPWTEVFHRIYRLSWLYHKNALRLLAYKITSKKTASSCDNSRKSGVVFRSALCNISGHLLHFHNYFRFSKFTNLWSETLYWKWKTRHCFLTRSSNINSDVIKFHFHTICKCCWFSSSTSKFQCDTLQPEMKHVSAVW